MLFRIGRVSLMTTALAVLTACGGGGGGGGVSGTVPDTPVAPVVPAGLFASQAVELPDPRSYYTCENSLFLNMIDAIDMNGDGRLDLVAHYWCNQWNKTVDYRDPTPNSLVVFLAQADGSYRIGNQELFGRTRVDLGGASRKSRVADFNGDGYPDIFYAMNHEDGRPVSSDNSNQFAQAAFLMSSGKASYRIDLLDPPNWYHGIDLARNAVGGYDAVANALGSGTALAFRQLAGQWTRVDGYPMVSGLTFSFVNDGPGESTQLVTGGLQSPAQLQLLQKSAGAWKETANILFESKQVPFTSWQGSDTDVTTIALDGDDIVAAGFDETCTGRLTPTGRPVVIGRMAGYRIAGGYKPSMGRIREGSTPAFHSLLVYEIADGQLQRKTQVIQGEDTTIAFNKYECRDINADGFMDLVGYPLTRQGQPVVYLNNGAGQLVRFSSSEFPVPPSCYGDTGTRLADLNGDGIQDLIMFRSGPTAGSCNVPPILVYYGKKRPGQ